MRTSFHHEELPKKRMSALEKKARLYTEKLSRLKKKHSYQIPETSLFIAGDSKYQNALTKALKHFKQLEHVVLVGIGGSSLGTEAVYGALAYKTSPRLTVVDSIDKESMRQIEALTREVKNPKRTALVIVSKSGTTSETMLNGAKALELFKNAYGNDYVKQVVCIGDKDTAFHKMAKKQKILFFTLPETIGGRYSVFTAVGIAPLTLLNIDTISLREGAQDALQKSSLLQVEKRAVRLALLAERGIHTVNFFTFNKRLGTLGMWYRQLLAESIGKRMTTKGTSFQYPLLPIVSTSVDLHSMAQLYLGGYKNLFTHFIHYEEDQPYHALTKHWLLEHVPFLQKKTFDEVSGAITKGVLKAYDDAKLPYMITEIPKCSAYEIGFLLTSLMAEVMYLAHLLNVNAFDQPSVELYKKHTRALLK